MPGKDVDHFFTSDKAVVDLYRDHDRNVTTMRVSAETGRIAASGYDETMTFEIEAGSYNAWSGTGLPTMVARDNLDPVDAVDDIEDEDDRFLAESIYRFIKDNPIQKVNGHALTELVRKLGWVPGEASQVLETEVEDLRKRTDTQRQYIEELQQKIISRQEEEEFLPEPDDEFSDTDQDIFQDILDDEWDEVTHQSMDGRVQETFKVPRGPNIDTEALDALRERLDANNRRMDSIIKRSGERPRQRAKEMLRSEKKPWWAK